MVGETFSHFVQSIRSFSNVLRSELHTRVYKHTSFITHTDINMKMERGFYLNWCIYKPCCHFHALMQTHMNIAQRPSIIQILSSSLEGPHKLCFFSRFAGQQKGIVWIPWASSNTNHIYTHTRINTSLWLILRKQLCYKTIQFSRKQSFILHHKMTLWHYRHDEIRPIRPITSD